MPAPYKRGRKQSAQYIRVRTTNTDLWILKMDLDPAAIRWERRKKCKGVAPGLRSGCTMVCHKGKGVMFGGVSDVREDEESLESVCYADMYQLNIDANKWYPFGLRKQKQKIKKGVAARQESDSDDEWKKFEQTKSADEEDVDGEEEEGGSALNSNMIADSPAIDSTKNEPVVMAFDAPCARFNAMMTVTKNTLYLFGGWLV
jgi:hypothetical protein